MIEPILAQTNITWYLFPLAAVISLVYNTSRYEYPPRILHRAAKMFLSILFFMGLILLLLMILAP